MTYKGQEIASTFVVGADLGRADFTSIQAALDALPAAGGEIFLRQGTYNISATITLPAKPVKIRGAGVGAVSINPSGAIAAFTIPNANAYVFEDFTIAGTGVSGQIGFLVNQPALSAATMFFTRVDIAGSGVEKCLRITGAGVNEEKAIVRMDSCSWFTANLASARHVDSSIASNWVSLYMSKSRMLIGGVETGGGISDTVLMAQDSTLQLYGAASLEEDVNFFRGSHLYNCIVNGVPPTTGIILAAGGNHKVIGCSFSADTAPTRWLDLVGDNSTISYNDFPTATSEAVRISGTLNWITDNNNCKITENGTSQANRYRGNNGFVGSLFGTSSTSSALGQDIGCRVRKTAVQTLTTGIVTKINFDAERYDTDAMHDNVTNNTRITINKDGKYHITATLAFASNATGRRFLAIRHNNTTRIAIEQENALNGDQHDMTVSTIYQCAKGDFLELEALQTSGGNLDVLSQAAGSPEFAAQLVG